MLTTLSMSQIPDISLNQDNFSSLYVPASQFKVPTHSSAQKYDSSFKIWIIKYQFEDKTF